MRDINDLKLKDVKINRSKKFAFKAFMLFAALVVVLSALVFALSHLNGWMELISRWDFFKKDDTTPNGILIAKLCWSLAFIVFAFLLLAYIVARITEKHSY